MPNKPKIKDTTLPGSSLHSDNLYQFSPARRGQLWSNGIVPVCSQLTWMHETARAQKRRGKLYFIAHSVTCNNKFFCVIEVYLKSSGSALVGCMCLFCINIEHPRWQTNP